MSKRKYTHLKTVAALILSMHQGGMTLQEIADKLGLSLKQMKNWSYRHNCEKRNLLKNWSGAAFAAPLRVKLNIFLPGVFFVLSVQSEAVHKGEGFCNSFALYQLSASFL